MADYTPDELNNGTTSSVNLTAGSTNTFTFTTEAVNSYFTLETTRNSNGKYDSNSPTNLSGSIENLVNVPSIIHDDDYIAGFVLGEGTSSFDFIPSEEITGALFNLRTAGSIYLSLVGGGGVISTDFIMTIDTTKAGSASNTFILKCGNYGVYSAVIDWGDGSTSDITTYNDADLTHVYSVSGVYTIKISGHLPWILFIGTGDKLKVMSIENWGLNEWESFDNSFFGCRNMVINAIDTPVLSNLTQGTDGRFFRAFYSTGITTIPNFKNWNSEHIFFAPSMFNDCLNLTTLDMSGMDFSNCTSFGTSGVEGMFNGCINLDSINVTGMTLNSVNNVGCGVMFQNIGTFDLIGLDTWNIGKVNSFYNFLKNSKITTTEYDKLLIAWDSQDAVNSLAVNFGTSQYTLGGAAATARAGLIANDLWTITDGGGI